MALSTAEQSLVARFNTATSALAQKLQDLRDNGPEDDTAFNAELTNIITQLEAMGQPSTPVPGPGPQPTP